MTYHLDTNAAIALIRNKPPAVRERLREVVGAESEIAISTVAIFELWYGAWKSPRQTESIGALGTFLAGVVSSSPFDEAAAGRAGNIRAALEARGMTIGLFDLLIAGQALAAGATLVTADTAEFSRVDGLAWEDWATAAPVDKP